MKTLQSLADNFLEFLLRQPIWSLIYFSAFYLGCTLTSSRLKSFWYDEFATFYISKLPDWNTIFAALSAGADLNPPPLYFFTRLSHSFFGDGEVATRMPATLGFLLMLMCLHRYIARLTNNAIAFASICLPLVTGAYLWAYEARPYGMMLGSIGAAVLLWQRAGSNRINPSACLGLAMSLAFCVTTQAYAVLAIGPFLLAELVRFYKTRQTRWLIWAALLVPLAALASYFPLLANHNLVVLNNPLFVPELSSVGRFYHLLLDSALFPLVLILVLTIWTLRGFEDESPKSTKTAIPVEDQTLAAGFLMLPIGAVLVGRFVTHIFFERYGLPAVVGATSLFAFLLVRSRNRRAPAYAAVIFCLWTILGVIQLPSFASLLPTSTTSQVPIEKLRPELAAVVSNGLTFMTLAHYAEPEFKARLHFLTDPKAAVTYTGANAFDVAFPIIKTWYGITPAVETYDSFVRRHKQFLLFGPSNHQLDWLTKKLIDEGASIRVIAIRTESFVCEVTMPR